MTSNDRIVSVAAPLRKQVTEALREAIVSFSYQPGERLVERDLCDRFGVSRTVVREALRHLEAEGLVKLVPNRGPVVSSVLPDEARELYEAREALESRAARLCAERATPTQKRQLTRALARVEAAYDSGSLAEELEAKDQFYEAIHKGANNAVIASLLRTVHARTQMLRGYSLQTPGRMRKSLEELQQMVEAIERGDGDLAYEIASLHVQNAGAAALARLAEVDAADHARPKPPADEPVLRSAQ